MDFLKSITGKVVAGGVALAVVVTAISWWQAEPATRQMLVDGAGKVLSWLAIVLILPWATFFLIGRVGRMDSNAAGAALVAAYTLAEVVLLSWLFDWQVRGATAWSFLLVGALVAGVYNLFTCDWIAEKAS